MPAPQRRGFVHAGLRLGAVLAASQITLDWARAGADVISKPQPLQARSPDGLYELDIIRPAQAGPHAAVSVATLVARAGDARTVVWRQTLPHRPQPRFAVVSDAGQVLLLDEALNVRSERAVTLIAADGKTLVQHTLLAVSTALGMPVSALAPVARHGPWMQAAPQLSAAGDVCEVQAGGRTLLISLRDGALSAR